MTEFLNKNLGKYKVVVEVWASSDVLSYAGKVKCPECPKYYTSTQSATMQRASAKAIDSLRVHMKRAHKEA
jgi:hypothetical protein